MNPEALAFIRAICANPKDDVARLVFADWLDEHGESERAAFIRWQIATDFAASRVAGEGGPVYSLQSRQDAPRGFIRSIRALVDSLPLRCGFEISRGFVSHVTCDAETFLAHADQLVWNEGMADACPACRPPKYAGHASKGGNALCSLCGGTGRIPRPMPEGVQPIERVKLTTAGRDGWDATKWYKPKGEDFWRNSDYPGIEFELP